MDTAIARRRKLRNRKTSGMFLSDTIGGKPGVGRQSQ
jgi:hypothetical protein